MRTVQVKLTDAQYNVLLRETGEKSGSKAMQELYSRFIVKGMVDEVSKKSAAKVK